MNMAVLLVLSSLLSPAMERIDSTLEKAVASARADAVRAAVEVLAAEGTSSAIEEVIVVALLDDVATHRRREQASET